MAISADMLRGHTETIILAQLIKNDSYGYENWDPFQKPNDPLDLRMDVSKRTTQQLVNEFLREAARKGPYSNDYGKGAMECALGVVNKDEKYQGIFDFCLWYHDLLKKEGHIA